MEMNLSMVASQGPFVTIKACVRECWAGRGWGFTRSPRLIDLLSDTLSVAVQDAVLTSFMDPLQTVAVMRTEFMPELGEHGRMALTLAHVPLRGR